MVVRPFDSGKDFFGAYEVPEPEAQGFTPFEGGGN